jgi:probable FeS assembly SUF system protein SufT
MHENTEKQLTRECAATRIPSGEAITLAKGANVFITQALGGSYTVATEFGLARIADADADALGLESAAKAAAPAIAFAAGTPVDEKAVWDQLRTCYDPEIPVNIVDLGLIYHCEVTPAEGGSQVSVKMTLTAPGCGMGPVLAQEAESKILTLPGVAKTSVELVWDPPWSPDRISAEGRQKLGME